MAHGVLALGLTAPGMADAHTLDALLRLPLERLLKLEISAQRTSHSLPNAGGTHGA